jgi:hypothetical protein
MEALSMALSGTRGVASVYIKPRKLLLFDMEGEEEEEEEETEEQPEEEAPHESANSTF